MVEEILQSFELFIYPSLAATKGMGKETGMLSCQNQPWKSISYAEGEFGGISWGSVDMQLTSLSLLTATTHYQKSLVDGENERNELLHW